MDRLSNASIDIDVSPTEGATLMTFPANVELRQERTRLTTSIKAFTAAATCLTTGHYD